jgi:type II secretion system protein H
MRKQSGFTLVEMMVVIALIGIITAAVIPNFIGWRNNAKVAQAARQVYSDLQTARTTAIKNNATISVDFNVGSNNYTMRGKVKALPSGVIITDADFTTTGNVATFNNLGFGRTFTDAQNDGTITVKLANSKRSSTIQVNSAGNIRIQ